MLIGDKHIKVQKASLGITQVAGEMGVNAMSMLAGTTGGADSDESRVLQLLNMVTPDELMDNDDYNGKIRMPCRSIRDANIPIEICEDVEEECSKFGQILALKVPRLSGGSRQSAGVGKIFVKYDTPASAKKALQALAGRKFADRTVVTTLFPEVRFPSVMEEPLLTLCHRKTLTSVHGKQNAAVTIWFPTPQDRVSVKFESLGSSRIADVYNNAHCGK